MVDRAAVARQVPMAPCQDQQRGRIQGDSPRWRPWLNEPQYQRNLDPPKKRKLVPRNPDYSKE